MTFSKTNYRCNLVLILTFLVIFPYSKSIRASGIDTIQTEYKWQSLGAPYIYANSDEGLVFGGGGGLSRFPDFYLLFFFSVSNKGMIELGIAQSEFISPSGKWKFLNESWGSQAPAYIYTLQTNDPEILAEAMSNLYELYFSALRKKGKLEVGPTTIIKIVSSKEIKDKKGNSLSDLAYKRFGKADLQLAGLRLRYNDSSPIRPLKGINFESALLIGRSMSEEFKHPKIDGNIDLKIGITLPIASYSRIYCRVWTILQLYTPEPLHQFLGWGRNHRGQPYMREWGRRFLSGRFQYHLTFSENSNVPFCYVNQILSIVPPTPISWEIVPFYDIGAIGDPEFGWHKTRHGFGIGIHMVMPPELVLRLDFAIAPGGPIRFFIGSGETL